MNTAATIWCTAAVGTLAGSGFLVEATIGAAGVLVAHLALRPIVDKIDQHLKTAVDVDTHYRVQVICPLDQAAVVRAILMRHINSQSQMVVQGISMRDSEQAGMSCIAAEVFSTARNERFLNDLVPRISIEPNVSGISWEKAQ